LQVQLSSRTFFGTATQQSSGWKALESLTYTALPMWL
jgi:hypothetical protein